MLDELSPLTVSIEYKIQWRRSKTDLSKLARLRWIENWSVGRLAEHLERSPNTIQGYLCKMKKPGGLKLVSLSPDEISLVKNNLNKVLWEK